MEVDEIQSQVCKLSRIGNGRNYPNKIGQKGGEQYQDEDEEDGEGKGGGGGNNGVIVGTEIGRLRGWHSSRIIRVSRASGGKDRHSKVLTAKGLRDRRVRLSVTTAIQFYDLQDRLGVDQPSKAVEWLIKAAADAISELPSLDSKFPETPKQPSDEKRPSTSQFDMAEVEFETEPSYQQQQHMSRTKSTCSNTSETSKGSVLSLSRSESRVKARERARERTAKDREKERQNDESHVTNQQNSHNSSFTQLLTGLANSHSPTASAQQNPNASNFAFKPIRQSPPTSMDYYTSDLFGPASSRTHYSSGFSGQPHFGIAPSHNSMTVPSPFNLTTDHHHELHQFSFLPDHLIPDTTAAAVTGGDYNLNCTISSGYAGFNRGTLQSNSPSPLPHLQRFSSPADGTNTPYFFGNVVGSTASPAENQFPAGFDSRLQLCYGNGTRHSDLKGKGKS